MSRQPLSPRRHGEHGAGKRSTFAKPDSDFSVPSVSPWCKSLVVRTVARFCKYVHQVLLTRANRYSL